MNIFKNRKLKKVLPKRGSNTHDITENLQVKGSGKVRHVRWTGIILMLLALLSSSVPVDSASEPVYPVKPITLICPWSPGGGSDHVAQYVARHLEQELHQRVTVVHRVGGGGVVGFTAGAAAEPDGYTLTLITTEIGTLHWMGITSINYKSFIHLALINGDPAAIIVRSDARWRSIQDLQYEIRTRPGKLRASGTGKGGIWDLCRIGWLNALDYPVNSLPWFPSHGAAPALQQLAAGQVDVVICSLPEAVPALRSGRAKALAVMAERRDVNFSDVPTLTEKGVRFTEGSFRGIAVPLGTPVEVVALLEKTLGKIVVSESFQKAMKENGYAIRYLPREQCMEFMAERDKAFGRILQKAGMVR